MVTAVSRRKEQARRADLDGRVVAAGDHLRVHRVGGEGPNGSIVAAKSEDLVLSSDIPHLERRGAGGQQRHEG